MRAKREITLFPCHSNHLDAFLRLGDINTMDNRTVRSKARNPTPRQRKAAQNLVEGQPIYHAMRNAGYSEAVAVMGVAGIPATVLALMPKESNLVELGRALTPELQRDLVRGRLALNTLRGKDAGVNSAAKLGSESRVNMFVPDTQVGLIVLNAPTDFVRNKDKILNSDE